MEKFLNKFIPIFCGLIVFLIVLLGLVIKPDGAGSTIDTEFLWDAWHPFTGLDVVGSILLLAAIVFISGVWKLVLPNNPTWGTGINKYFWAAGALGIILIFAS